ncbi:MAG: diguanylate cyclase [Nisaea sp.]|jgi:diguanylate cyclase (GGDEF)-like protein|uniref:diguanylate cyclase n=1 Tax=Nisaea sp. TaxID=2024842 RepID=UPI001B2A0567|nr:diguanylate cyclase [Nisaea sp.]MBO6562118.1 diguanylate cyclase [Nisaea sp.]
MSDAANSNDFKILVVDDAPENVMLLGLILKDQGTVTTATSGRQAIDIALENQPDLILLDIQMPDLDGYDVIRVLKEDDRTKNVPVIFVTGLSDESDEEKGLELGAIDYITKPYKPAVVLARVRNHLRLREYALRLEQLNEKLELLATTDPLTSAHNRRYFMSKLQDELERVARYNRPSSVLMLDIDHFKSINDTYGHDVGDAVLVELVKVLGEKVRHLDTVARLGGEEFAILLPETNEAAAKVSAVRLLDAVRAITVDAAGKTLKFTVSIGCAEFDGECGGVENILKSADLALYEAKHSGRDRVVTKSSMQAA